MIGIMLSPEQVRRAPLEVRRWLQREIAASLGLDGSEPALHMASPHLVGLSLDEARTMLSAIYDLLPVVSVFFELGREPATASGHGVRALRLDEMARHARLQSPEQVIA